MAKSKASAVIARGAAVRSLGTARHRHSGHAFIFFSVGIFDVNSLALMTWNAVRNRDYQVRRVSNP
jgi:hypothetical protein